MHLRQPQFAYSACGPFTRHKKRIKKFKQTRDKRYIYRNVPDKACFQHDSAYADHKDLINRTKSDKVLRDKGYDIASNPEYNGYQRGLANMVYKFLIKIQWVVELQALQYYLMNFINLLLKNLIKEKYIRNLKIIYGE